MSPVTRHPSRSAFSLVELLIAMGLLTLIVLGLLQMFNQTQRAFRTGMSQSDVLESGRAVTELVRRELEQMTPSDLAVAIPNFQAQFSPRSYPFVFRQNLPGTSATREDVLEQFFFLTRQNLDWKGIGYVVVTNAAGVGTLYRFESPATRNILQYPNPSVQFQNAALQLYQNNLLASNLTRVADGVCHLRITAFDRQGFELKPWSPCVNSNTIWAVAAPAPLATTGRDFEYFFCNNAVPAFVELEIGFLEDRPLARLRSIPDPTAQANYLQDRAAQIHIFRQRIPIRAVDTSVYP